jgi:hypothetical protein
MNLAIFTNNELLQTEIFLRRQEARYETRAQ